MTQRSAPSRPGAQDPVARTFARRFTLSLRARVLSVTRLARTGCHEHRVGAKGSVCAASDTHGVAAPGRGAYPNPCTYIWNMATVVSARRNGRGARIMRGASHVSGSRE